MRMNGVKTAGLVAALVAGVSMICLAWVFPGRMTGGGSVFVSGMRVTHGFELHCQANNAPSPPTPNNLEINWGPGNHFHLDTLIMGECLFNPDLPPPNPPVAGFNTFIGVGTGTFNGTPGAEIMFVFTDEGEPGTKDMAQITIKNAEGNVVLDVPLTHLTFGNQQAHNN